MILFYFPRLTLERRKLTKIVFFLAVYFQGLLLHTGEDTWIGGFDGPEEGEWEWVGGDFPWNYTNWQQGNLIF